MPDGPQPERHPWSGMLGPVLTGRTPYPTPPQPPLRRSLHPVYALGPSSRRGSLDRLSLRSGQRFLIGTPSDPDCCPRSMAFSLIPLTTAGGEVYWR
jgi:hypothetical protein